MSFVWPITARETMAKTKRHLGASSAATVAGRHAGEDQARQSAHRRPQRLILSPFKRVLIRGLMYRRAQSTRYPSIPLLTTLRSTILQKSYCYRYGSAQLPPAAVAALLECRCRSGRCVGRAAVRNSVRSLTHLLAHADKMKEECWPGRARPKKEH